MVLRDGEPCVDNPERPLSEDLQPLIRGILRVALYSALVAAAFGIMYLDAVTTGQFTESSGVELAQSALLFVITAIFVASALKVPALTHSAWLLATFAAASLVRENDALLDSFIDESWEVLAFSIIAIGLYATWRNRKAFLAEQKIFTESTAFGLFVSALLTTYVFSRLFGMGKFWKAVMQDGFLRQVKDMNEECLELFGYTLLLCAAIEFIALTRRTAAAALEARKSGPA